MPRRTKIVATIGPSSSDPRVLADMIRAGMNVARISLAHTPFAKALELHALVRATAEEVGATVATMVDLPGPLVRIGRSAEPTIKLAPGHTLALRAGKHPSTTDVVSVDYAAWREDLAVGDRINLGESAVVEVLTASDEQLTAITVAGGLLAGRAAVRIPRQSITLPVMSEIERQELAEFVAVGVDIVSVSARSADELDGLGLPQIPDGPMLFAKIESMAAVEQLPALVERSHGIIIGRGALGLECPLEELPHLQKHVTEACIADGRPVVTASQMLESMLESTVPTRAETTDVSNAVFDGTSALMLSSETAVGAHPALVVATMATIARRADEHFDHQEWSQRVADIRMAAHDESHTAITDATTIGAARSIEELRLRTVLCISATGFTVRSMARFRPRAQILGLSSNPSTVRQLAASWGVTPVLTRASPPEYAAKVAAAIAHAKGAGLVESGELVGVVAGISATDRVTDTFRFARVP